MWHRSNISEVVLGNRGTGRTAVLQSGARSTARAVDVAQGQYVGCGPWEQREGEDHRPAARKVPKNGCRWHWWPPTVAHCVVNSLRIRSIFLAALEITSFGQLADVWRCYKGKVGPQGLPTWQGANMSEVVLGNRGRGRTTDQPLGRFRKMVSGGIGGLLRRLMILKNSHNIPNCLKRYKLCVIKQLSKPLQNQGRSTRTADVAWG